MVTEFCQFCWNHHWGLWSQITPFLPGRAASFLCLLGRWKTPRASGIWDGAPFCHSHTLTPPCLTCQTPAPSSGALKELSTESKAECHLPALSVIINCFSLCLWQENAHLLQKNRPTTKHLNTFWIQSLVYNTLYQRSGLSKIGCVLCGKSNIRFSF